MKEELERLGALTFTNEHNPDEMATEVELTYSQISTWDNPYKLFLDGQLTASYKTWNGISKAAQKLISYHGLERTE